MFNDNFNAQKLVDTLKNHDGPFTFNDLTTEEGRSQLTQAIRGVKRTRYFILMATTSMLAGPVEAMAGAFLEGVACGMELAKNASPDASKEISELERLYGRPMPEA